MGEVIKFWTLCCLVLLAIFACASTAAALGVMGGMF